VIEDAEIELSLILRLDYKLSLESPVTYRIILNRLPQPTGAQLVHEGIGLSSRRQSGKLERQSAKCKHRHRDTTVVVIGCADSISGAVREGWGSTSMYIGQKLSFGIDSGEIRFQNGVFPLLKINSDTRARRN